MIKESLLSIVKGIIVDYFVTMLLALTLITGALFALDYYVDQKKAQAVQIVKDNSEAIKIKTSEIYTHVLESNTTKAIKTSIFDTLTRASSFVDAKLHTEETK